MSFRVSPQVSVSKETRYCICMYKRQETREEEKREEKEGSEKSGGKGKEQGSRERGWRREMRWGKEMGV